MVLRAFSGLLPWMKKSLSDFPGLPYWSHTVACSVCSSEKSLPSAPIGVNFYGLCAHLASFQLQCCLRLRCKAFQSLLSLSKIVTSSRTGSFLCFSFDRPPHLMRSLIEQEVMAEWNELDWYCKVTSSQTRLMEFPWSEAAEHVYAGSVVLSLALWLFVYPSGL